MNLFDLTGKVALLTGASRGMGLEMAKALAAHGPRRLLSPRASRRLSTRRRRRQTRSAAAKPMR